MFAGPLMAAAPDRRGWHDGGVRADDSHPERG